MSINGVLSFGLPFPHFPPLLLPPAPDSDIYQMYFIAPYWADNDARLHGSISWEMYSVGYSPKTDDIINNITDFINYNANNMEFSGNFVFVANWNEYPTEKSTEASLPYLHMVSVSFTSIILMSIPLSA